MKQPTFMPITYFENHVVKMLYHEENQLGLVEGKGFMTSDEFKEVVTMGLRMIDEYKPLRWLADNRKLKAIRQADQDWFVEVAMAKLRESTIRRNATVVSEDIFNRMAIEQILQRSDDLGNMLLKEFESMDEAMEWVLKPVDVQEQQ